MMIFKKLCQLFGDMFCCCTSYKSSCCAKTEDIDDDTAHRSQSVMRVEMKNNKPANDYKCLFSCFKLCSCKFERTHDFKEL